MIDDKKLEINCNRGKGIASIICVHHLTSSHAIRFIENSSDYDDLQGWCFACEYFFKQEGEMTSRFKKFNNAKVVCEKCYKTYKIKHSID